MKSLKELLIVGPGPSSSHTIAPYRIAKDFIQKTENMNVVSFEVTLYGSLALTGKGHSTDMIIQNAFLPKKCDVDFVNSFESLTHPNTMECRAILTDKSVYKKRYISIGGGSYIEEGGKYIAKDIYPFSTFDEMKKYMKSRNIEDIYAIIEETEGKEILEYAEKLLALSFHTIEESLHKECVLPGPLKLKSVAKSVYETAKKIPSRFERRAMLITSYAYATAEANARGEQIVTTPTCGASGVVPAVLYYERKSHHRSMSDIAKAFLVGALVCAFIKENASVSGALLGCQAEIGSASSFAAASLSYLNHLTVYQIEYAAEVSMEHFLGLTCDPVDGYVQIPCIERNGIAAIHSYSSFLYARYISGSRKNRISFDNVIKAMEETGSELPTNLKETSLGGLAKIISC